MAEQSKGGSHAAGASATFEAEIRKRSKPILSPEEQEAEDRESIRLQTLYAASRDREVAEALLARSKEREAAAAKLGGSK